MNKFFDALDKSRCAQLTEVTADAADWIAAVVHSCCLNARVSMDAFHVVAWATEALDEVRRDIWNQARREGDGKARRLRVLALRSLTPLSNPLQD